MQYFNVTYSINQYNEILKNKTYQTVARISYHHATASRRMFEIPCMTVQGIIMCLMLMNFMGISLNSWVQPPVLTI